MDYSVNWCWDNILGELDSYFIPITKIKPKWLKRKVFLKNYIEILEQSMKLHHFDMGKDFIIMTTKAKIHKIKD